MDPTILLAAILVVPVVILLFLRVNAAMVFLSICLGSVLVQFIGQDAATILQSTHASAQGIPSNISSVNLILQLLPVVLTTVFMIRSVRGGATLFLNLFPALGASALLALLTVPLVGSSLTGSILQSHSWRQLENLQTLIVGASTLLVLLFMWMQRPRHHADHDK